MKHLIQQWHISNRFKVLEQWHLITLLVSVHMMVSYMVRIWIAWSMPVKHIILAYSVGPELFLLKTKRMTVARATSCYMSLSTVLSE